MPTYCKLNNDDIMIVFSDNTKEKTMNLYPISKENTFNSTIDVTSEYKYSDIMVLDSNLTTIKHYSKNVTTDKEKYIKSWGDHIKQFESLGYALINASDNVELYDELQSIEMRLFELVKIAADEDFK